MNKYYLAYDVLLNPTKLKKVCPFAKVLNTSFLEDYQMCFKGKKFNESYLTIVKEKGQKVPVTLYQLTSWDEYRLDNYKLLIGNYQRIHLPFDINGKQEQVLTYVTKDELMSFRPFFYEVSELRHCYRDLGLDQNYIDRALMVTEMTKKKIY